MKNLEPDALTAFVPARTSRPLPRRAKVIIGSVAFVLFVALGFHFAGDALLNRFVRPRLEQACASRRPGSALQLGALKFEVWRNRLRCDSVELVLPGGAHFRSGVVTVQGMSWFGLLVGSRGVEPLSRHLHLEIADLFAGSEAGEYQTRCEHLRVSVPDSEVMAEGLTLQPAVNDEDFFAADGFRRVRHKLAVASCTVRGVAFPELLTQQGYRVASIELQRPVLESLIDREKPRRPPGASPRMPHELLGAIEQPFRIDRVAIIDGVIKTLARRSAEAEPGMLTFTAVQITAKEIANAAARGREIEILARGRLMDAGLLTVQMKIPVAPPTLAFHYSGALAPMDLTCLDQYLDGTGRFQIKSGSADGAAFDIDVTNGHAAGVLKGVYRDFQVRVLNRATGSEKGVTNRVATVLTNQLKIRRENDPHGSSPPTDGKVDHVRAPEESFLMFAWMALRSGIVDLMTQ